MILAPNNIGFGRSRNLRWYPPRTFCKPYVLASQAARARKTPDGGCRVDANRLGSPARRATRTTR